ncbi:MAG: hypothetical protein ABIP58_08300 [Dehalococcoidia bacterium]
MQAYEANWYNLVTGATERVERFDDHNQFWISAWVNQAVVLGEPFRPKTGGATLAVYDLETGQETPLTGLFIGYPSEGIPLRMVQPHLFDARFVWADWDDGGGVAISEAALDGSSATLLDRVPSDVVNLSSDGLVLYHDIDSRGLTLRDTKTGAEATWDDAVIGAISPVVAGRS